MVWLSSLSLFGVLKFEKNMKNLRTINAKSTIIWFGKQIPSQLRTAAHIVKVKQKFLVIICQYNLIVPELYVKFYFLFFFVNKSIYKILYSPIHFPIR